MHPLIKFMELESQTDQGPGMRRVMGADIVRADGHHPDGQVGAAGGGEGGGVQGGGGE